MSDNNAQLIAAAPDLLEAARSARALLNGYPTDDLTPGEREILRELYDAINKAEGREEV